MLSLNNAVLGQNENSTLSISDSFMDWKILSLMIAGIAACRDFDVQVKKHPLVTFTAISFHQDIAD